MVLIYKETHSYFLDLKNIFLGDYDMVSMFHMRCIAHLVRLAVRKELFVRLIRVSMISFIHNSGR